MSKKDNYTYLTLDTVIMDLGLSNHDLDINSVNDYGDILLMLATAYRDLEFVQLFGDVRIGFVVLYKTKE